MTVRDTYNKVYKMRYPIEKINMEKMKGSLSSNDLIEVSRQTNIFAIKNTWRKHNKGLKC